MSKNWTISEKFKYYFKALLGRFYIYNIEKNQFLFFQHVEADLPY